MVARIRTVRPAAGAARSTARGVAAWRPASVQPTGGPEGHWRRHTGIRRGMMRRRVAAVTERGIRYSMSIRCPPALPADPRALHGFRPDARTSVPDPLAVCEAAARAGGQVLLDWIGRFEARQKGPRDLVTEADFASQREIRRIIAAGLSGPRLRGRGGRGGDGPAASTGQPGHAGSGRPLDRRSARRHDQLRARLSGLVRLDRSGQRRRASRSHDLRPAAQRMLHRPGRRGSVSQRRDRSGCRA